ncbi:MAG: hypothetical protein DHS20C17_23410 [Cyclobacteriaceae bacterium]|nr:MAG: hypothetical protein DHS20C17_23410 [Cyclobacteriaceae bacterium]
MKDSHKALLILAISLLVFAGLIAMFSITVEKFNDTVNKIEATSSSSSSERPLSIDYSDGQNIYVPAYSYLPGIGGSKFSLSILLSIRNTDPNSSISLTKVDYYDTDGQLAKRFLLNTIIIAPMETKEYFIEQSDQLGGSGANFFINWNADSFVYEPVVEALMYGMSEGQSMEFKSQGLIIKKD